MEVTMATGSLLSLHQPRLATPKPLRANSLTFRRNQGLVCKASDFWPKITAFEGKGMEVLHEAFNDASVHVHEIKIKLDALEPKEKKKIATIGGGALLAYWLTTIVSSAIDSVPVLPKLMKVIGFGYTVWFGSHYLVFKEGREELAARIAELELVLGLPDEIAHE